MRFEYALAGGRMQPVRITETGYSHGQPVQRGVTVSYDAQGRIQRIDGPLPGDEDRVDFKPFTDGRGDTLYRLVDGLGREILPADRMSWLAGSLRWLQADGRFDAQAGAIRHVAANGVEQRVVVDDFGRITRTVSPMPGWRPPGTIWPIASSGRRIRPAPRSASAMIPLAGRCCVG